MTAQVAQPMDKPALLARIQSEWSDLQAVITRLTERQMTECAPGEWAIKDHLAHIAAWENFLIANQFQGQSPPDALRVPADVILRADENEMNAILWERHRRQSVLDILAAVRETHAALLAALDSLSEYDLQTRTLMIGSRTESRMTWTIYNTYEHYAEHRKTIEAKRNR